MPKYSSDFYEDVDIELESEGSISSITEPAGFMGVFGKGLYKVFYTNGSFTVPIGITQIRVRVIGGGGATGGSSESSTFGLCGGAGGGYAHGVFNVTSGSSYGVTVGSGGIGSTVMSNGGSSSFGVLISATGGESGKTLNNRIALPIPGQGYGGDFQAKGGSSEPYCGGGAAGSQLGDGGWGRSLGGAGVGGNDSLGGTSTKIDNTVTISITENDNTHSDFHNFAGVKGIGGASCFEPSYSRYGGGDIFARYRNIEFRSPSTFIVDPRITKKSKSIIRFPFDGFIGSGGPQALLAPNGGAPSYSTTLDPSTVDYYVTHNLRKVEYSSGGPGAGGGGSYVINSYGAEGGNGGVGGGGGASLDAGTPTQGDNYPSFTLPYYSNGGYGGGAGFCRNLNTRSGYGGQGLVIVEW